MQDQLITFETAVLAKEKGFNITEYLTIDSEKPKGLRSNYNPSEQQAWFLNISQSLLQKWLREKHNLHIILNTSINTNGKVTFYCNTIKFGKNLYKSVFRSKSLIYTYEEALEVGLQEGLKLIK